MMKIWQTLRNLIKLASIVSFDSPQYITVNTDVNRSNIMRIVPYGIQSQPPITSDITVLLLQDQANEASLRGIETDMNNRDTLNPGEVALGVPTQKARVYMTNDDLIRIFNENATLHTYLKNAMTVIKNLV